MRKEQKVYTYQPTWRSIQRARRINNAKYFAQEQRKRNKKMYSYIWRKINRILFVDRKGIIKNKVWVHFLLFIYTFGTLNLVYFIAVMILKKKYQDQ